jgi:CheY-like chemotaxis protein
MEFPRMNLSGKRIFLVEDNQGNAAIIQLLLEQERAVVLRGRWGGLDTLNLLEKHLPIDIILMDLMLPNGITGYDVFDEIRARPGMENIPIIAVSASDYSTAIPQTQAKGFNGFIAKPLAFNLFASQVRDVLDGKSVWYNGLHLE